MRDYDINKQGNKKMVNPITPEHNGPNGHKIPDFFQRVAQNLPQPPEVPQTTMPPMLPMEESNPVKEVSGQSVKFLGPQGLVYGGPNTDAEGDAPFKEQTPVETVGRKVEYKDGMPVVDDYTVRKRD